MPEPIEEEKKKPVVPDTSTIEVIATPNGKVIPNDGREIIPNQGRERIVEEGYKGNNIARPAQAGSYEVPMAGGLPYSEDVREGRVGSAAERKNLAEVLSLDSAVTNRIVESPLPSTKATERSNNYFSAVDYSNPNPPDYGRSNGRSIAAPRSSYSANAPISAPDPYGVNDIEQIKGSVFTGGPRAASPAVIDMQLRNQEIGRLSDLATRTQRVPIAGSQDTQVYTDRQGKITQVPVGDFKYQSMAANPGAIASLNALLGIAPGNTLAGVNRTEAETKLGIPAIANYHNAMAEHAGDKAASADDPVGGVIKSALLKDPNEWTDVEKLVMDRFKLKPEPKSEPSAPTKPTFAAPDTGGISAQDVAQQEAAKKRRNNLLDSAQNYTSKYSDFSSSVAGQLLGLPGTNNLIQEGLTAGSQIGSGISSVYDYLTKPRKLY